MATDLDLDAAIKRIDAKLRMLKFTREDVPRIRGKNELKALERLQKAMEGQIDGVHEQMFQIQALRIENGDDPVEVREWSLEIERQLEEFQETADDVREMARNKQEEALRRQRDEEEMREEEKRRRHYEEELKLEEARMKMKREYERKFEEDRNKSIKESGAKLPKLTITQFQGTHLDWLRFWSQFETEIDKASISQVAKFSYLKELLISTVRVFVDGLPYNSEGYERAKFILSSKYGKSSEVANAHMQEIIGLSTITGTRPAPIQEFYEKLTSHVQVLETMGKIKEIHGFARTTLDKLPGIRADLVRLDDNWQEWGFSELIESLRRWCDRNPVPSDNPKQDLPRRDLSNRDLSNRKPPFRSPSSHSLPKKNTVYQTKDEVGRMGRGCIYCNSEDHKATECKKVPNLNQRKKILSDKRLCFNCTGAKHQAQDCRSKTNCQLCGHRHHTSICDKQHSNNQMMLATGEGSVIYPVVVVVVDGIKCRALLDTGSGSSYASAALVARLNKRPFHVEHRQIEMMLCSTVQKVQSYSVKVGSVDGKFEMTTRVSKVDKGLLLTVPNPNYEDLIRKYCHLQGVVMNDDDKKSELPIHVILGASEYSRIKTETKPKIGQTTM